MMTLYLCVVAFLVLAGIAIFCIRSTRASYLWRFIAIALFDLASILLLIKFPQVMREAENWLQEIVFDAIGGSRTALLTSIGKIKDKADLSGYILTFFSIGSILFNLLDTKRTGTKNPYPLTRIGWVKAFAITQVIAIELEIYAQILGLLFVQCILLLILFFTTLALCIYYVLCSNPTYMHRIMMNALHRILKEQAKNPQDDPIDEKGDLLQMRSLKSANSLKNAMNEVAMWGRVLLSDDVIEAEGIEQQTKHIIDALRMYFDKNLTKSEEYSCLIPFAMGYAILLPGAVPDEAKYRDRFVALLRYAASIGWKSDYIQDAVIEGLCVARIQSVLQSIRIICMADKEAERKMITESLARVFRDCVGSMGICDEMVYARLMFQNSMRVWSAIAYLYGSWREENTFALDVQGIGENYSNIGSVGKFRYEITERHLALQTYNVMLTGYCDSSEMITRKMHINECFKRQCIIPNGHGDVFFSS